MTEWRTEFYGTLVPERDAAGRLRRVAEHEVPVERDDGGQALIAEFSRRPGLVVGAGTVLTVEEARAAAKAVPAVAPWDRVWRTSASSRALVLR